ncbi:MAG: hypothetical protein MUP81_06330 [Dehalococcoidia bacterium]|nr:hypothetical protein [Dehalococcoidia bacterium]
MDKVYIVTTGSYSDYHIKAVFFKKPEAEAYRVRLEPREDNDIEEYDIGISVDDYFGIEIRMSKDGSVTDSSDIYSGNVPGFVCFDCNQDMLWRVATFNVEKAVKVVNEKRIQIIALGLWGEGVRTEQWNKQ